MRLWMAARNVDPATRFLYLYRIIEYASYSYLDNQAFAQVKQIMRAAHALHDTARTTEKVVSLIQQAKVDDYQRFSSLIKDCVDPALIWRELSRNQEAFCSSTTFDGGFTIDGFVKPSWTSQNDLDMQVFANTIRKLRNALFHGKDQGTAGSITPTAHNFQRLQPWASVAAVAAGEIMLNQRTG
jgi:hypothetical protein